MMPIFGDENSNRYKRPNANLKFKLQKSEYPVGST